MALDPYSSNKDTFGRKIYDRGGPNERVYAAPPSAPRNRTGYVDERAPAQNIATRPTTPFNQGKPYYAMSNATNPNSGIYKKMHADDEKGDVNKPIPGAPPGYGYEKPATGGSAGSYFSPIQTSQAAGTTTVVQPRPTSETSTTTWTPPTGPMPTLDYGEFEAPEYDRRRVKSLTQQQAAPETRRLRQAVQQAMASQYENPASRAMSLREALAGYGLGLEGVMRGAHQRAAQEYNQEYGRQWQESQINFQTGIQEQQALFQSALQDYFKQYKQTRQTDTTYDDMTTTTTKDQSDTQQKTYEEVDMNNNTSSAIPKFASSGSNDSLVLNNDVIRKTKI